jgi:hypothetical protein
MLEAAVKRLETLVRQLQGMMMRSPVENRIITWGAVTVTFPGASPFTNIVPEAVAGVGQLRSIAFASGHTHVNFSVSGPLGVGTFSVRGLMVDGSSPAAGSPVVVYYMCVADVLQ